MHKIGSGFVNHTFGDHDEIKFGRVQRQINMANMNNAFAALHGAGEVAFTSAKKKNKSKPKVPAAEQGGTAHVVVASSASSAPSANGHAASSVVDVSEATAILERAAREARTITDKCKLWKEWTRQVCMHAKIPNVRIEWH